MIKITKLIFAVLLLHAALYATIGIEKYIERTPKVQNQQANWIFEFKNKDKEDYRLTIVSGNRMIADELPVSKATGSSDSSLGYVRISSESGLDPLFNTTYILLRNEKNKTIRAWTVEQGPYNIFVSYEKGKLTPQRSGVLQGIYASKTTSGLQIKTNIKQDAIAALDADWLIGYIKKYVK